MPMNEQLWKLPAFLVMTVLATVGLNQAIIHLRRLYEWSCVVLF